MPKGRRDDRTHLFLAAIVEGGGSHFPVRVRNLSPTGALVEGPMLPVAGSPIVLRRGPLAAAGHAIWVAPGRAGLKFEHPLAVGDWLPNGINANAPPAQSTFDKPTTAILDAAFPLVQALPPTPNAFAHALAELVLVQAELGALGEQLARDPDRVARNEELRSIQSAAERINGIIVGLSCR